MTETKKGFVKHRQGEPPMPEITEADLLVLADELRRFETEHPELTVHRDLSISNEFVKVSADPEISVSAEKPLIGWKRIADHMDCSIDTAKRRAKNSKWLKHSPEGKPTAMPEDINRYMTSNRKK